MIEILFVILALGGIIFLILRLFIRASSKRLARDMMGHADIVAITLYKILREKLKIDYFEKGKDFYGAMAATIVNEFFDRHNEKTITFFAENKEDVLKEIGLFVRSYPELRRPITDALRVSSQAQYMLTGIIEDNSYESFQKAIGYGVFLKGGEFPKPDSFREMALDLAEKYGSHEES